MAVRRLSFSDDSSSCSSSSSGTLTPDEEEPLYEESRFTRALHVMLSDDFDGDETLQPNRYERRRANSTEDILLTANELALQTAASEYWKTSSSTEGLNRTGRFSVCKTTTLFTANHLWRAVITHLDKKFVTKLAIRRVLSLHRQHQGSVIVQSVLDYFASTSTIPQEQLTYEQARTLCEKLLYAGVMENPKNPTSVTFDESFMYSFTGQHAWTPASSRRRSSSNDSSGPIKAIAQFWRKHCKQKTSVKPSSNEADYADEECTLTKSQSQTDLQLPINILSTERPRSNSHNNINFRSKNNMQWIMYGYL